MYLLEKYDLKCKKIELEEEKEYENEFKLNTSNHELILFQINK